MTAVRKAVIEAFQTRTWSKAEQREEAIIDPAGGFGQVRDFDDHVRLSLHPDAVTAAAFLDASEETVALSDLPDVPDVTPSGAIAVIVERLDAQGVRVAAVNMTSPDIAEAGLWVAKVIAPAMSPLDAGYHARMLGSRRLYQRAHAIGLAECEPSFADLNPWPHPFP